LPKITQMVSKSQDQIIIWTRKPKLLNWALPNLSFDLSDNEKKALPGRQVMTLIPEIFHLLSPWLYYTRKGAVTEWLRTYMGFTGDGKERNWHS
jgi:hypothetical protein